MSVINFGIQSRAGDITLTRKMTRVLESCKEGRLTGDYSAEIDEYGFIVRISGTLGSFGQSGPQRANYFARKRFLAVDIVISEEEYVGLTFSDTAVFLADHMLAGWDKLFLVCKRRKLVIDRERVLAEWNPYLHCVVSMARTLD